MLWIYVPLQYPCDIPWEGSLQIWHNYRSPRRMRASNLSMQNNFLMKQCLLAMNERRNSMKLVFTVNFNVSFKVQTSEFHPHRMRLLPFHVHLWFSIAYFHVKCEKYLISPPSTEVLTTFRSSAETPICSQNVLFLPILQSPFRQNVLSAIYGTELTCMRPPMQVAS